MKVQELLHIMILTPTHDRGTREKEICRMPPPSSLRRICPFFFTHQITLHPSITQRKRKPGESVVPYCFWWWHLSDKGQGFLFCCCCCFLTTSALKVSNCGPSRAKANLGLCANHKTSAIPTGPLRKMSHPQSCHSPPSVAHSLTSWPAERGLNVGPTFLSSARLSGRAQSPVTATPLPNSLPKPLPAQALLCHPECNYPPRLCLTFCLTYFLS